MADQRFKSVVVLTGAGISAESGVPTFRGEDGLWRQYRAEDLATPQAFAREPTLVWEWYDWRRRLIAACEPNAAHRVLAQMERSYEILHSSPRTWTTCTTEQAASGPYGFMAVSGRCDVR